MSGNTFGKLFCVTSFGESHGPAIGCVVDGCPPGLALTRGRHPARARSAQARARRGTSRSGANRIRWRSCPACSKGATTGTPIALLIRNEDARSKDYANIADTFRPGHADYTYWHKYGIRDYRGGGRQSARETAVRVAAGAIARKWLARTLRRAHPRTHDAARRERGSVRRLRARRRQSVFRRQRVDGRRARSVHGRAAQVGRLVRRADRGRRVAAFRSAGASRSTTSSTPTSRTR